MRCVLGLVVTFGLLATGSWGLNACPTGWSGPSTRSKCYKIGATSAVPFDPAAKVCTDLDPASELASIEDAAESAYLTKNVLPFATDWLVTGGHRDPLNTGPWKWADGSTITYSDPGNPPQGGGSANNYLYLYSHTAHRGTPVYGKTYADPPSSHQVLCQLKDAPVKPTPAPTPVTPRPTPGGGNSGGDTGSCGGSGYGDGCGSCGCSSCGRGCGGCNGCGGCSSCC